MYDEGGSFRFGIPFKDVRSHASGKGQPTTGSLPSFDENLGQLPLSELSIADIREQGLNPKSRATVSKGREHIAQIYAPILPVQPDNPLNELADVAENQTRLLGNGNITTNSTLESCVDSNDSMDELINWSQPEFPVISPELQLRISGTHLCNVHGRQMRQLQFQHDISLTAYQIIDVPEEVRAIRKLAVEELVSSPFFVERCKLTVLVTQNSGIRHGTPAMEIQTNISSLWRVACPETYLQKPFHSNQNVQKTSTTISARLGR